MTIPGSRMTAVVIAAGLAASCCPEPQCPRPGGVDAEGLPLRPDPGAVEEFFGMAYGQVSACLRLAETEVVGLLRCEAVVRGSDASITELTITSEFGTEADECVRRVLETRPFPHRFQAESAPVFFVYTFDGPSEHGPSEYGY
jgi:hypothetical protein